MSERNIAEEYINYITSNAVPKALSLEDIAIATKADPLLQQVECCLNGAEWPDTPELKPYKRGMRGTKESCGPNKWSERKYGGQVS